MVPPSPPISRVLKHMADAVPAHPRGDESCDIASSCEVVALLVHAIFVAFRFELELVGNDDSPNAVGPTAPPTLPLAWNARSDSFSFLYAHPESSNRFIVRIRRLGNAVEIRGLTPDDERTHLINRSMRDVVNSAALPIYISLTSEGGGDRSDLTRKLCAALVSEKVVAELQSEIMTELVQSFVPDIDISATSQDRDPRAEEKFGIRVVDIHQVDKPLPQAAIRPRRSIDNDTESNNNPYGAPDFLPGQAQSSPSPVPDFPPPGFEDELEINRARNSGFSSLLPGGRSPFGIGGDDLHPPGLSPHDPLRGSLVGGGLPRPGGFSGMHLTFDDPLFDPLSGSGGSGHDSGGFGPQVPPGARWDPIGPDGRPGRGRRNNPFGPSGNEFSGGDFV